MNDRILHNLGLGRKLLLTTAAALAIAIPVMLGLFTATPSPAQSQDTDSAAIAPTFSSVSLKSHQSAQEKPGHFQVMFSLDDGSFIAHGVTLERLIQIAYHVQGSQISGGPEWINTALFDIDAKFDNSVVEAFRKANPETFKFNAPHAIQSLLSEQFKFSAHSTIRIAAAYDLVVDPSGSKLQSPGSTHMMRTGPGSLAGDGTHIELLAEQLSIHVGRPVLDKTGLKGEYSFNLHWTPDKSEDEHLAQSGEAVGPEPAPHSNGPSLVTALQEQLGLKLEPNTEPVQVLVVDHAEIPEIQ